MHTSHLGGILDIRLLNEMANSVDFYKQNQKQQILRVHNQSEYSVGFIRDGKSLLFSFDGFGDLMGYYVYARSDKHILAENRIGIYDDVSLYIMHFLSKDFRIVVREDPEPRDNY